jgi:hypothetical protein
MIDGSQDTVDYHPDFAFVSTLKNFDSTPSERVMHHRPNHTSIFAPDIHIFIYDNTRHFLPRAAVKRSHVPHRPNSPFNALDSFTSVEDASSLATRIRGSTLQDDCSWLADFISSSNQAKAISEQSTAQTPEMWQRRSPLR